MRIWRYPLFEIVEMQDVKKHEGTIENPGYCCPLEFIFSYLRPSWKVCSDHDETRQLNIGEGFK